MTQSGQGNEPQPPAVPPAHEGVVLPAHGDQWAPEQQQAAPAGGQPWGAPWGPQGQEQPSAPAPQQSSGYAPQPDYGQAAYGQQTHGQSAYGQQPGQYGQEPASSYGDQPAPYGQQSESPYGQQGQPQQPGAQSYGQAPQPQPPAPYGQQQGRSLPPHQQPGAPVHGGQPGQGGYAGQASQPGQGGYAGPADQPGQVSRPLPRLEPQPPQRQVPPAPRPGEETTVLRPVTADTPPPSASAPASDAEATQLIPPAGIPRAGAVPLPPREPPSRPPRAHRRPAPPRCHPSAPRAVGTPSRPRNPRPYCAGSARRRPPLRPPPPRPVRRRSSRAPPRRGRGDAGPARPDPGGRRARRRAPAAPAARRPVRDPPRPPGGPAAARGVRRPVPGRRRRPGPGAEPADSTQQLPVFDDRMEPPAGYGANAASPYGDDAASPRRRGVSRGALIGIVVAACAVAGLAAGAALSLGGDDEGDGDTKKTGASATPGESAEASASPTADPVKEQAKALDTLLADSGNSRASVIRSVGNIRVCKDLTKAATDLRAAAGQRNALVTRLAGISVDKLPNHAQLTQALNTAWKSSASADNHYAAWADQVGGKKGCHKGRARNTGQTVAAETASRQATTAKRKAAALWNPIAKRYGLTERRPEQL
ncbi:hypothetical protein [Streptomyces sp. XD-27]|uniref:hypothetical protein n=1 Tax=Streptomyces sp. XD-27 TaxID=3062779 RepID=UPI0026F448BE|nr:hypothetical protein [Streptomyces sp. XD-27]WKX70940.1 hypothetical protein Q3Y56_14420 [Streptomyces sp. XD-27]